MKQAPPVEFFSNENFENLIKWHHANLLELERERDRLRYILEEAPTAICQRYGIKPMKSTEDTLQAVLKADGAYQRQLYRVGRIQVFLDSLSPEEQQFVTMRFIKGQQWSELAEAFNVSVDTVRKRWRQKLLTRAKKIMIAELFQ